MATREREQDRANSAIAQITDLQKRDKAFVKEYATRAQGLPSMIQNLGLGGTIAFLRSKDKEDHLLADHLSAWLLTKKAGIAWDEGALAGHDEKMPAAERLLRALAWQGNEKGRETTWLVARRAADEARLYAGWLKRLSKAAAPDADSGRER